MYVSIRMTVSAGVRDIMTTKTPFVPHCPDDLRGKKISFTDVEEFKYIMQLAESFGFLWHSGDKPTQLYNDEYVMDMILGGHNTINFHPTGLLWHKYHDEDEE